MPAPETGSRAIAIVATALLSLPAPLAAQAVVIANASIIDASAADPIRVGSIIVEDGRITAVGTSLTIPDVALTIDARGKFVVPGPWDMHAHLAALTSVGRAPEQYVGHGVLNVRDMGGHTAVRLLSGLFDRRHLDATGADLAGCLPRSHQIDRGCP